MSLRLGMRDPSFDMVILDELNIVLRYDYLTARCGGDGSRDCEGRRAYH